MDPLSTEVADQATKVLATELANALLRPILKIGQWSTDKIGDILGNRFEAYISRQLEKHSHLPTIVFQVRKPIEDLYIPLTLTASREMQTEEPGIEKFKITSYLPNFLPTIERVLVVDDAGMGKSTLSRFLLLRAAKMLATVPIFIELRHLSADRTVLQLVLSELNPIAASTDEIQIDQRQLGRLLKAGVFTFFFDGYDEISDKSREAATRDIKKFIESYPENKYLITSRPDPALTSFPNFKVFKIQGLSNEEAFELIRKYDCNGDKGERLIERLNDSSLRAVHSFLHNPLLVTLLYRAYEYKNSIPLRKPVFYRQVFDALYEWHDLTKDGYSSRDKKSGLDIDGFHRILRGLGFVCLLLNKVDGAQDEWLQRIRDARSYCSDLKFSESNFLEDAVSAVPVLRREGNSILWMHKSLLEYFAAQFLISDARVDQGRICEQIAGYPELARFTNFLDILYDSDIALFGRYFVSPVIELYMAEVARLTALFPDLPSRSIKMRASVCLGLGFILDGDTHDLSKMVMTYRRSVEENGLWKTWKTRDGDRSPDDFQNIGLHFYGIHKGTSGGEYGALGLAHHSRAIINLLSSKKHPLMIQRAFLPDKISTAKLPGLRKGVAHLIDGNPSAIWNKPDAFDGTTYVLMRHIGTAINIDRVDAVWAEIKANSSESSTTSSLLSRLSIRGIEESQDKPLN